MKRKRHNIAPFILEILRKTPYGKATVLVETKELKANSIQRFLGRHAHMLRDFYCITRIMPDPRRKNAKVKAIFLAHRRQANYTFSYII